MLSGEDSHAMAQKSFWEQSYSLPFVSAGLWLGLQFPCQPVSTNEHIFP